MSGSKGLAAQSPRRHSALMTDLHRFQSFDGVSIGYRTLGEGWPTLAGSMESGLAPDISSWVS